MMAKGDDLWGDEPALGPRTRSDGQPTSGLAVESSPANDVESSPANESAESTDAPATEAPSERSVLDYEADRIDRMGRTDLDKKQAYELTAIRMLLERLSARLEAKDKDKDKEALEPDKGEGGA